jgi:hypothetical protein
MHALPVGEKDIMVSFPSTSASTNMSNKMTGKASFPRLNPALSLLVVDTEESGRFAATATAEDELVPVPLPLSSPERGDFGAAEVDRDDALSLSLSLITELLGPKVIPVHPGRGGCGKVVAAITRSVIAELGPKVMPVQPGFGWAMAIAVTGVCD